MEESKHQNLWAQYASKEFEPVIKINRFDDNKGTRFYWWQLPDGEIKVGAGITGIFGKILPENDFLTEWKINIGKDWRKVLNAYSKYGTDLHTIFLYWMRDKSIPQPFIEMMQAHCEKWGKSNNMPEKNVLSFIKFLEDFKITPLIIEGQLSCVFKDVTYCLTLDLFCQIEFPFKEKKMVQDGTVKVKEQKLVDSGKVHGRGALKGQPKMVLKNVVTSETPKMVEKYVTEKRLCYALVDFKSNFGDKLSKSFFDDNKYQLIGAKEAIKQNFGIDVECLMNFSPDNWKTEPKYTTKTWEITGLDIQKFVTYLESARLEGLFTPSGKKMVFPKFDIDTKPTDFKQLDYVEYVKEVLLKEDVANMTHSGTEEEILEEIIGEEKPEITQEV